MYLANNNDQRVSLYLKKLQEYYQDYNFFH